MKLLLILSFLFSHAATAAGVTFKPQADTFQMGKDGSTSNKDIIFNTGDGASNPLFRVNQTTKKFEFNKDALVDGTLQATQVRLGAGTNLIKTEGGKLKFSNDGTIFKDIGSGSGSAGAFSFMENAGFEDGITSNWSFSTGKVTATNAANALIGTISAVFDPAAQNEYLRTSFYTVPKGLRGSACEARFKYTGGDALNYSAKVVNEAGVTLATFNNGLGANVLPIHSLPDYESIFFKCPTEADVTALSTNGNVRLEIYQGTVTNAAAMTIDDSHFGGLIGLVESTTPDSCVASFTGTTQDSGGTCPAGLVLTIPSTGMINLDYSSLGFTSVPNIQLEHYHNSGASPLGTCSYSITPTGSATQWYCRSHGEIAYNPPVMKFLITKTGSDAKQSIQVYKSIPKITENFLDFSAVISGAGAVVSKSSDWITASRTTTGTYALTFTGFTITPSCVTMANSSGVGASSIGASSASGTVYTRLASTGALTDYEFSIHCKKVGIDSKLPTVQPMVIGQVTNSAAETSLANVRTEACTVLNSGSATIGNNLCNGWIQSVVRNSAGNVSVFFKAGIFSDTPVCTGSQWNTNEQFMIIGFPGGGNELNVGTLNDAGGSIAFTDGHFSLTCTGKR